MNSAIIVAAGKGLRMGGPVSKQYLSLAGVPILARTLNVFEKSGLFEEIIVVVAATDKEHCCRQVIDKTKMAPSVRIVAGGRDRQESVFNGLEASRGQDDDTVLIHDGVRPFVTEDALLQCLAAVKAYGACIVAVPACDTLKQIDSNGRIAQTLPRDTVWLAQTPQGFRLGQIRAAHRQAREEGFVGTDDAQLVERLGQTVTVVTGSRANIKITTPDDLLLAEAIWRHMHNAPQRD
jgi:2-C-methyl-D-erythritol 4-phosphate cytidylyltransferase